MHLLKFSIIFPLFLTGLLLSCKSEGPLSPKEAFNSLKAAYARSNAGEMEKLLSEGSIEKIRAIIKMFSRMNENQLKALGERFGVSSGNLKKLSVRDYLAIQLSISKETGGDTLSIIAKQKFVGVDIKEDKAVVRMENGMELVFVKEGLYWKFDMNELSSKN